MTPSELQRWLPEAPAALLDILGSQRGELEPPIRSEIFGLQRFAQHGRSLGLAHRAAPVGVRKPSFFPRLRSNIRTLREAHRYIGVHASTGYDISPAAEWLLDNFHLIEAQLEEVHAGLPRRYFRALPMLQDEPLAGLPRIYGVAWAFVAHTDGAFDEDLLIHFLSAYQETRELNLGEMWALPTTLRVVLIENLRRLAERVATNKAAREVANLCCDRIQTMTTQALDALLDLLTLRGVGRVFLGQMAQRLHDRRWTAEGVVVAPGLDEWLRLALPDLAAMQMQQRADQTADNLSVSNAVSSLRAIGDADWADIVARASSLMRLMLGAPVFEAEHAATRDQTLHGIERLAQRYRRSEVEVARTLLALMHGAEALDHTDAVPSHWLRGAGRPALMQALGLHERGAVVWRAWARRLALPAYLGAMLAGTAGVVAWILGGGAGAATAPHWMAAMAVPMAVLTGALMSFPASEAVVAVINRLISESLRPRHLPRLALASGIPIEHRVLVAVPAMLSGHEAIQALVHRLELHHLANPERHTQFALLSDMADADQAVLDTDAAMLVDTRQALNALNHRYPVEQGDTPRFILLHRERQFSTTEGRWIGSERKRGKLEALVAALAEGSSTVFLDLGTESRLAACTPYIVTLDSDTQLPPGRLRELVGVAAHPHNQPRLSADGKRVVAGYGILQPRIATPLPAPKEFTLYHWLFAGQCGIDPYSAATSEVYQDLFDEGTFTGKGLLNVRALHAVLARRLPEGQVLSHDLLEGSLARCAAVTDITLIEDAPFHADVAASRVHRWMRGDWQLLPFLLQPRRWPLAAINRWKMFDNLRRSLVAPMSLALLLLALSGWGVAPGAALALVLAAFAMGPLMGAIAAFSPSRDDVAKQHFYAQAGIDLARALAGGLWHLAQLGQQAWMASDAVLRALHRQFISRRHLLQWTTAAAAQASAKASLGALVSQHWQAPLLSGAGLLALWAFATPWPRLASVLCGLWAAAPLWTWWVSRPHVPLRLSRRTTELSRQDQAYLEGIARDSWRFFERCVGPQDHHLPPDNLQTIPQETVAHRTSPTNIGLYLLSAACARQFGWISTLELIDRIEAALATMSQLQRHRGHFMNWYDTQTLAPLLPMYVSTVDSGNLSGHLLAVAQACAELARDPNQSDVAARLQLLTQNCERLATEPDYCFLYHRKRHLLHLGFRVAEQQLDAGFYDLLASESRLTSLWAIAKGDVPVRHWASLGRPFYAIGAEAGLRSWSGSMFEYLMPTLVLDEPHGSVLHEANHAALREQIAYARAHAVPWGISESAYAGRDHTLAYQYSPQGVPALALRRTPSDELVVAPYATALAALIAPRRAVLNFAALQALSARADCGFIEALDFTPARKSGNETYVPVGTFMAHHQGMSIVALANVLLHGVAQRWGMANAHIEAVSSLLHERAPREVSVLRAQPPGPPPQALRSRAPGLLREVAPGATALAPTHVLGNGRYHVSLRANGAGNSRWGAAGITRWRDDALRDAMGSFFYVRWDQQPQAVSITQHPAPDPAATYLSIFHADRVCFDTSWPTLQAHTTVWVSPEDDIEFRQVELRNLSDRALDIELISAFDVTLADPRADETHPAFSNLFVRATWRGEQQALMFERKPRLSTDKGLLAAHFVAESDPQVGGMRMQTDRQRWLGRNRSARQPLASLEPLPQGADVNHGGAAASADIEGVTGLDPVCVLALRLRIEPRSKAQLTIATAASEHEATLRAVIDKYRQPSHVQRASLMSATLAGIRLRASRINPESFAAIQTLTSAIVLSLTRPQPAQLELARVVDRRLLWRFGISGDRPIVLVFAAVAQAMGMLRTLAQALRMWSWGGVACDLVVLNAEAASYQMSLQQEMHALRERHVAESAAQPGPECTGMHVLRVDELSVDELSTLQGLARVRLNADGRPLPHHVQEWCDLHELAFEERHATSTSPLANSQAVALGGTAAAATVGGFAGDGGEFRFNVSATQRPLRPWVNVLANNEFGAQISEGGGGYSWALNSRLNQLTAWSNDPVIDPPAEWFLLQDARTREVWSVSPSSYGGTPSAVVYRVVHGQGYTHISHRRGELDVTATWCVDATSAVKQLRLRLLNRGHRTLQLRAVAIAEWQMGAQRSDRGTVHTALHRQRLPDQRLTALLCTQPERSAGFGEGTAFLALAGASDVAEDWTCDRRELFDATGGLVLPDHFGRRSGAGLDPCAALSIDVVVAAGETVECTYLLGYAANPAAAKELATVAATKAPLLRLEEVRRHWNALLGATQVSTPDPLFDAMVNRWLLYQTVACRLWARSGFYQAGGAFGFRDQLQDSMALAWAAPAMLRAQIVLGASRQFVRGDVQHWWHEPGGAGVRTHFSDDLLWLPHACLHYLQATGDTTLLDERVPFLEGADIPDGAEDAYYAPSVSGAEASVYEHGALAIERSLRVGVHGLPLMGSGDWNDGMNRVGHLGRGESVWLAWFLCQLVERYAPWARARGDAARAARWALAAEGWKAALTGPAWDGQWFKRAFFDDGTPLGSSSNTEARIDLIAQAWAVLSGAAPEALQRIALTSMEEHLVDPSAGLIRLLHPPLAHAEPSAGYIQAYPPGVRENGGQYSHGGVWALMAQAAYATADVRDHAGSSEASAHGDAAYRYFTYLSPAHRAAHPTHGAVYGIEPYVMAGDVYTQPPYVGRGGWSWYTGAAAWMHRAAIEAIFGLQMGPQELSFRPCLPSHWPRAELVLKRDRRTMRFVFVRGDTDATAPADAQRLAPGKLLRWIDLPAQSCFVMPLHALAAESATVSAMVGS